MLRPGPGHGRAALGFYARNGARTAGYDTEMFGVPYKTLYWAEGKVDESALMEEHRFVYASTFAPDKFRRYVRIPFDPMGRRAREYPGSSDGKERDRS